MTNHLCRYLRSLSFLDQVQVDKQSQLIYPECLSQTWNRSNEIAVNHAFDIPNFSFITKIIEILQFFIVQIFPTRIFPSEHTHTFRSYRSIHSLFFCSNDRFIVLFLAGHSILIFKNNKNQIFSRSISLCYARQISTIYSHFLYHATRSNKSRFK